MKAVGNIKKITAAMKMVASSKMRADLNRLMNGKNFGVHLIPTVFSMDPQVARRSPDIQEKFKSGHKLLLPITSDKGLCGAVNSNLIRELKEMIAPNRSDWSIICIGDKGTQALVRPYPDLLKYGINELSIPMNYYNVMAVTDQILRSGVHFDRMVVLYNEFVNSMKMEIRTMELMSLEEFKLHFKKLTIYNQVKPNGFYTIPYFYSMYVSSKCSDTLL
jgi:F-type H+-transporting ATPase subunit gamma